MGMTIDEHTCDTCEYGEWYRRGYDVTMMDDECGGCCSWNDKWKPGEVVEDGNDEI